MSLSFKSTIQTNEAKLSSFVQFENECGVMTRSNQVLNDTIACTAPR